MARTLDRRSLKIRRPHSRAVSWQRKPCRASSPHLIEQILSLDKPARTAPYVSFWVGSFASVRRVSGQEARDKQEAANDYHDPRFPLLLCKSLTPTLTGFTQAVLPTCQANSRMRGVSIAREGVYSQSRRQEAASDHVPESNKDAADRQVYLYVDRKCGTCCRPA